MRVQLTAPHNIGDRVWPIDSILDLPPDVRVTPDMIGLDSEARQAIYDETVRVYGRWVWNEKLWKWELLDDPPIKRTLDNAQPVPPIPGDAPPR